MSNSSNITRKQAWQVSLFFGAFCLIAAVLTRGYLVGGFIPAPLFALACGAFLIVNVFRAVGRN